MRHRNRRLATIAAAAAVLTLAVGLGLFAIRGAIVFFYSPSEIATEAPAMGARIRVGGLVEEGSVVESADVGVEFVITDRVETVQVHYSGILPDLFREGQGVIAEGHIDAGGIFIAETILAKHDETYMPEEVADALRDAGVWQGED
jgi:cytochrome c-type biogenesis protein CcmE